jgi:hypothetical protein
MRPCNEPVSVATKLAIMLIITLSAQLHGQTVGDTDRVLFNSADLTPVNQLHGFAITSNLNPYSQASLDNFKGRAEEDFRSSLLTSVYLAFFGNLEYSMRTFREFAIHDYPLDSLAVIDSTVIGRYTVLRVGHLTETDAPCRVSRQNIGSEPVLDSGCWFVKGEVYSSGVDPHRSYIEARQEALQRLSLYLGTRVNSHIMANGRQVLDTNFQFSSFVFFDISIVQLIITDNRTEIVLGIPSNSLLSLN